MTNYFHAIDQKMWWIVDVGFPEALGGKKKNLTQAKEKSLHLEHQGANILYQWLSEEVFKENLYK